MRRKQFDGKTAQQAAIGGIDVEAKALRCRSGSEDEPVRIETDAVKRANRKGGLWKSEGIRGGAEEV